MPNHEGWIDAPPEGFAVATALRFRSRLHRLPVTGELRVLELTHGRVRARLRFGLLSFEARFSLNADPQEEKAARIGLALTLPNQLAVVSGCLDRFAVRKLASELAEQTLAALTVYCEERELADPRA